MKTIGLFGGTFDPVHNGHLAVARAVLDQLDPALLYFIPAAAPPHKSDLVVTPFAQRLAMLRLALQGQSRYRVSDIEGERPGPSYTIDTLAAFRTEFGENADLFFVIGLDAFAEIGSWKCYRKLLAESSFVVIDRPSHDRRPLGEIVVENFPDYARRPGGSWVGPEGKQIISLAMAPLEVSSSLVRETIRQRGPVDHLLPPLVVRYLHEQGLYRIAD
ncbi:MAG: nicotinate-nucleotide adenylyltransferase [Thermodesulfobacteriota bacterium]